MTEPMLEVCFVIMPFGEKVDVNGLTVDFDVIYGQLHRPAIEEAGLRPVRCDEVKEAGFIHRKMIEFIWNSDVALVDISLLNPNVFYELGIRHSLRKSLTVIVRRKGTAVPFNIGNLNVIEYDEHDPSATARAKSEIVDVIRNGVHANRNDSLVHEVMDFRIATQPRRLRRCEVHEYEIRGGVGKSICLITGDIQGVRGIDVWVNSENTNMQMARFYDWSISSVIRYLGATRDVTDCVTEDTIADELNRIMAGRHSVPPGTVIPTSPGELGRSHDVKRVFHAAAVAGQIGEGYSPIPNTAICVTNALRLADSPSFREHGLKTILFPLLGIGVAPRGDQWSSVQALFEAFLSYVMQHASCTINKAYFLTWTEDELKMCQSILASMSELDSPHVSR